MQPSITAASSTERGTLLMKPWYKNTERLKPKPPYIMMRPTRFFYCKFSIRLIKGYMTA